MDVFYSARIAEATSGEAGALYRAVVRVYVHDDDGETRVAEYELTDLSGQNDPGEADAVRVLADYGWRLASAGWDRYDGLDREEWTADVEPADWQQIVKDATAANDRAKQAAADAYTAWQTVIRRAQLDQEAGRSAVSAVAIAAAAGIGRKRVYQIRDGRR